MTLLVLVMCLRSGTLYGIVVVVMLLMCSEPGTYGFESILRGCADGKYDGCFDTIEQTMNDTAEDETFEPETSVTCLCSEDGCNDGDADTIKLPGEFSESRICPTNHGYVYPNSGWMDG